MTNKLENVLLAIQGMSFVGVIVALILAVTSVSTSRYNARYDTCYLLRGIVYSATVHAKTQRAAATEFINNTSLANCKTYANTDK